MMFSKRQTVIQQTDINSRTGKTDKKLEEMPKDNFIKTNSKPKGMNPKKGIQENKWSETDNDISPIAKGWEKYDFRPVVIEGMKPLPPEELEAIKKKLYASIEEVTRKAIKEDEIAKAKSSRRIIKKIKRPNGKKNNVKKNNSKFFNSMRVSSFNPHYKSNLSLALQGTFEYVDPFKERTPSLESVTKTGSSSELTGQDSASSNDETERNSFGDHMDDLKPETATSVSAYDLLRLFKMDSEIWNSEIMKSIDEDGPSTSNDFQSKNPFQSTPPTPKNQTKAKTLLDSKPSSIQNSKRVFNFKLQCNKKESLSNPSYLPSEIKKKFLAYKNKTILRRISKYRKNVKMITSASNYNYVADRNKIVSNFMNMSFNHRNVNYKFGKPFPTRKSLSILDKHEQNQSEGYQKSAKGITSGKDKLKDLKNTQSKSLLKRPFVKKLVIYDGFLNFPSYVDRYYNHSVTTPKDAQFKIQSFLINKLETETKEVKFSRAEVQGLEARGYGLGDKITSNQDTSAIYNATYSQDKTKSKVNLMCKVIDKNIANTDTVNKFLPRELKILKMLKHPNVIHPHSVMDHGTKSLVFIPYADHGNLLDYIRKHGALRELHTKIWFKQIVSGANYLHTNNIVHRDLRCENILISNKYCLKISDFGLSRHYAGKGKHKLSETYCGSAAYSAPEVISCKPYNPRLADVWSLGVILFVMLNGSLPFADYNIRILLRNQINKHWSFRSRLNEIVSTPAITLLDQCLEPIVAKRCTMDDIVNSEFICLESEEQVGSNGFINHYLNHLPDIYCDPVFRVTELLPTIEVDYKALKKKILPEEMINNMTNNTKPLDINKRRIIKKQNKKNRKNQLKRKHGKANPSTSANENVKNTNKKSKAKAKKSDARKRKQKLAAINVNPNSTNFLFNIKNKKNMNVIHIAPKKRFTGGKSY